MEDKKTTSKKTPEKKQRHLLPILVVGALIVLAVFVLAKKSDQTTDPTQTNESDSQAEEAGGRMYFAGIQGQTVFPTGEDIVVDLYVDTSSKEIGGYDAVFSYDGTVVEFDSAENLLENFQMFSSSIDDPQSNVATTSVTGIMELESKTPVSLQEQPVARLTFKPLKKGSTTLAFHFEKGETNDSNLVLINTNEILGEVENFDMTIGDIETLAVGRTYTVPGTGLQVTLDQVTIPDNQCADCTSDATVTATLGSQTETLTFSNGGIAGKIVDTKPVLGHTISVRNIINGSVELSVTAAK